MFKPKYYLNPETLRFEKVSLPFWKRIFNTSAGFIFLVIVAAGLRIGFDHYADSPKVTLLLNQNKNLKSSYQYLNDQINRSEKLLAEVQKRDDHFYRAILDVSPIPRSIRDAGMGGSENINDLLLNRSADFVLTTANQLEKLASRVKIQSLSLEELSEIAYHKQKMIAGKPSIQPIAPADSFWLTSTYGVRSDPFTRGRRMHPGIDLAGRIGLKIYATGDGVVTEASVSRHGYGKEIIINHGYGYTSRYAHLHKIMVEPGDKVKRGQHIGLLGSTGRSTGPHLHYEVLYYGKPLNPMYFYYEDLKPDEFSEIVAQASAN